MGGAILGADLGYFGFSGAGCQHGGDVAAVIGGDQRLVAVECDAQELRNRFEGGEGRAAVVALVEVVIDIDGGEGIRAGEFDAEDGGAGTFEFRENGGLQIGPGGAPGLVGGEDGFAVREKEFPDLDGFEVVDGEHPDSFGRQRLDHGLRIQDLCFQMSGAIGENGWKGVGVRESRLYCGRDGTYGRMEASGNGSPRRRKGVERGRARKLDAIRLIYKG